MSVKRFYGGYALRISAGITTLVLMLAGGANAVNYISGCTEISYPGEYVLNQNLGFGPGLNLHECIRISSNNVIFDGADHWIIGSRHSGTGSFYYGIVTAGQLYNVTVKNVIVKDWRYGIYYGNVQNGNIIDSAVWSNEMIGINLDSSSNNTLTGNNAYTYPILPRSGSDYFGIGFIVGNNSNIDTTNKVNGKPVYILYNKKNIVLDGIEAGHLDLKGSNNITIKNSNISDGDGIGLFVNTSNIIIYHNNIINNSLATVDYSGDSFWDNGYPSGGNYWGIDYNGIDNFRGPNQDQPGSDGIGDTPYNISGDTGAQDRYPFMSMNGWKESTGTITGSVSAK